MTRLELSVTIEDVSLDNQCGEPRFTRTVDMTQTYFKRYRMEISLRHLPSEVSVPVGYQLLPWSDHLLDAHADVKYRSFRDELDSSVFPCLGEESGCHRLMSEISKRDGFVLEATWLAVHPNNHGALDFCGTVQGVRDHGKCGGVQNLGVTPEHRGHGLGTSLLCHSLLGFRQAGARTVHLEVTAQNARAVRLYRNLGFQHVKTVYKAIEVAIA